jgi:hypothetical protein
LCEVEADPAALRTVSVTVYVPVFENWWTGFFPVVVLERPEARSPKFHAQEVGEPVDVSMNCSVRRGPALAAVKEATGTTTGDLTVTDSVVEPLPEALEAISFTL